MMKRIHIFGASGSGTTTLGAALADRVGCPHFDTDQYFWLPTDPPYEIVRDLPDRTKLLRDDLEQSESWVLSGSLCGWGDFAIPLFDLVVFLALPVETRMERLRLREIERNGPNIDQPDHARYRPYRLFMDWAAEYDTGGLDMRSKTRHEQWMTTLSCPVVRIEHEATVEQNVNAVIDTVMSSQ